jgi:flavin reductase (DIM6/NTAB) family NADH-FMN oxidoreductase RutF
MKKVTFPIDKREWHPGLIPGPIVLVSTYNSKGIPNIAPKSWVQMVSFEPPIILCSGSKDNTSEVNVLDTQSFVLNIVNSSLADKVYNCIQWFGQERIEKTGFHLSKAIAVNAPIVDECPAHLECKLHKTDQIGTGFIVYGEIVAASIREDILNADPLLQYKLLDQILFLESEKYARTDVVCKAKNSE